MDLVGKVLAGRYEIIEEIGSGGMAKVYKAKCRLLNRYVAVKVLRNDLKDDEEFVNRFRVEARAAASLTHPNIVSIYDVGNEDGIHYIVMEYVEGKTLKEYIDRSGKLPWREATEYAIQIAKGLEQAHKNSVIHRDVKPHNIIMTPDGTLKVTDFGIARATADTTMTFENSTIGTVHYISPEQARGGYTDERSDIYSLGIVMYEMLTGNVPFDNESPVTIAIKHIQEKPVSPREYSLSIPKALEDIVLKAIAKEQNARYRNAGDLIHDLKSVLNDAGFSDTGEKHEDNSIEQTLKMPSIGTHVENVGNDSIGRDNVPDRNKKRHTPQTIDKKREKKVIIAAVISAVVVILIISYAFMSITGMGGMFSNSKSEVEIPNLVGKTFDDVKDEYKDSEFSIIKSDEIASTEPEGTIISQDPKENEKVKKKDNITIKVTVSKGKSDITLKDYTKYTDSRKAEIELGNLGLIVNTIEEYNDTIPKGSIIRQIPPAGEKVNKDDIVSLYVSKGPKDELPTSKPGVTEGPSGSKATEPPPKAVEGEPNPTVAPAKKSAMLTVYGPADKDSATVQVKVNGKSVYSKTLAKGQSEVVKLEGTSGSVEVEVLYDGVSKQKQTVQLH